MYLQQRKMGYDDGSWIIEVLIEDHVCDASQLNYKPYLMRTGYVQPSMKKQHTAFMLPDYRMNKVRKRQNFSN